MTCICPRATRGLVPGTPISIATRGFIIPVAVPVKNKSSFVGGLDDGQYLGDISPVKEDHSKINDVLMVYLTTPLL